MSTFSFEIGNSHVNRTFSVQAGTLVTTGIWNRETGRNYIQPSKYPLGRKEFAFRIGLDPVSIHDFSYESHERQSVGTAERLIISLNENREEPRVSVSLIYEVYEGHPVIRKWLEVRSLSDHPLRLHDLHWEVLTLAPVQAGDCDIYGDYARNLQSYMFEGGARDSAVVVHNPLVGEGFVIGNEAPSALKRTSIFEMFQYEILIGMNHGAMPFERILHRDETFVSPKGFLLLYKDPVWQNVLDQSLQPFVREHLYVDERFRPNLLYCTWQPFLFDLNEKLLQELADQGAKIGVDLFLIDAGWHNNIGDYDPDPDKFPNGMEPICRYISDLGMVPGLWFGISSVFPGSAIANEHPEWFCKTSEGDAKLLEGWNDNIMCLTTPWKEWITNRIADYVRTCKLGYVKLDLVSAINPYGGEPGCYAGDHPHRSAKESVYQLLEAVKQVAGSLRMQFPDLLVDVTFETWGNVNIADFALASFSDVSWTINTNDDQTEYRAPLRLRQEIYDRARLVPPDHLMMGCMNINRSHARFAYLSGLGTIPVFLGDLRQVSEEECRWFKDRVDWMKSRREHSDFYPYYQVGDVFERPRVDNWDGFARLNRQGEGIVAIFRNESAANQQSFVIPWVLPDRTYRVQEQPNGNLLGEFSGEELRNAGISISQERNSGLLLSLDIV